MHQDSTPSPKSPAKFVFWERRWQRWRVRVERNKSVVFDKCFDDIDDAIAASKSLVETYCRPKPVKTPRPRRSPAPPKVEQKPREAVTTPWYQRPENKESITSARHAMWERRRAWYREFMAGRVCADCEKGKDDGVRLQWHHRDPATKIIEVSRMISTHNSEKILAEIAKCTLLCKDCHWKYHRKGG